jgi:hypothetical protein
MCLIRIDDTPMNFNIRAKKLPGPGEYDVEKSSKLLAKNVCLLCVCVCVWFVCVCTCVLKCEECSECASEWYMDLVEFNSDFVSMQVPKFSFQGRPGPPELPEPFANYSTSRLGTASMSRRSKTAASEASRSLNSSMSSLPEVKGGSGSDVLVVDEKSCDSLRSSSSFRCVCFKSHIFLLPST